MYHREMETDVKVTICRCSVLYLKLNLRGSEENVDFGVADNEIVGLLS